MQRWTVALAFLGGFFVGCGNDQSSPSPIARVELANTKPPIVTKAVADQITVGMNQQDAMALLVKAAGTMSPKYFLEAIAGQSSLNKPRFELTLSQDNRKLVLKFKDEKLVEKSSEGLDD